MLDHGSCDWINFDGHRAHAFKVLAAQGDPLQISEDVLMGRDGRSQAMAETLASASDAAAMIASTSASPIGVDSAINP